MTYIRLNNLFCAFFTLFLLSCGGGNKDQNKPPPNLDEDVVISGKITFDKVPHRESNSSLNFLATEIMPARGLTLQLLDSANNIVRETKTDNDGNYAISASENTSLRIRVLAELLQDGTSNWNFSVTDNTDDYALYAMEGGLLNSGFENSTRDLHAPSGWVDDEYREPRIAAPFAILDVVHDALTLLESADENVSLSAAEFRWSVNNKPVRGSTRSGDIGTSYYDTSSGNIYLLGYADNDTDEYDSSVIAHEFAHLLEQQISRNDNFGGDHSLDDALDPRLAFSEGWGNAFASMALNDPFYRDSYGANQDLGFGFSVEVVRSTNLGWYKEDSVQNILFDIFDDASESGDSIAAGFAPIYQSFISAEFVNSPAFLGIHQFVEVLRGSLSGAELSALNILLANHNIFVEDEFATDEPNNASNIDVLPLYVPLELGSSVEVCSNNENGEWNKLANRKFLLVDLPNTNSRTVNISVGDRSGEQADASINVFYQGTLLEQLDLTTYNVDEGSFTPLFSGYHILEYFEEGNIDELPTTGARYCAEIGID